MSNLYQFNPGKKSWKMYANTITSISGDDLTIIPHHEKNLILEVSGNKQIIFKQGDTSYNLADLSNNSSNNNANLTNYSDASFGNVDISGTLLIKNGDFGFNTNISSLSQAEKTNIYTQLTSTTTDSNSNSFSQLSGIAYSPTQNIYILISNTKLWSSSDCQTWNEVTTNLSSIFTSNSMSKNIKYIPELDKFFVVSRDKYSSIHTIWYSSTGLSWTISILTGSDYNSSQSPDDYGDDYMHLTYIGNNKLICTILFMDSRDWEANINKHYLLSTDGGSSWYQYAYGNEYGTSTEITNVQITNNDPSITSTYIKHESRYILFYGAAYGTIKILHTTTGAKDEWSILNWTSHLNLSGQKNVPPKIIIYSEELEKVVAIIVNYDIINIFYSSDGLSWTESVVNTNLPSINLSTSHFNNRMAGLWADSIDKFIVYTLKDTIESSDGINWSIVTTTPSSSDSNEFLLDKYKYHAILDKNNGRIAFLLQANTVVSTNSNYVNSLIESYSLRLGNSSLDISSNNINSYTCQSIINLTDTLSVQGATSLLGNTNLLNNQIKFESGKSTFNNNNIVLDGASLITGLDGTVDISGDLDISGELKINNISEKTNLNGVNIESINIKGSDITSVNSISASNYNVGNRNVISASAEGNFTDLELKNNNGTKLLIDGDSGDIEAYGILYIDNINEKTNLNGVNIESINIKGSDITSVNSISAINYAVGSVNIISAARQANFKDLELKNNSNQVTLLAQGNSGDISMAGTLYVDTIKGGQNMVIDPEVHDNNTGKLIVKGDLEVQGTTTTINSTTLDICDNRIKLNATSSTDGGIDISFNDGTSKSFYYNKIESQWKTDDSSLNVGNGSITANSFIGNGSQLTGINTNLKNYDDASFGNVDISGTLKVSGLLDMSANINMNYNKIIFSASDDTILPPDSGIIQKVQDLSNTVTNNLINNYLDTSFGNIDLSGHIIPTVDASFDIGSADRQIRHLYVSNNTIYIGDITTLGVDNSGNLKLRKRKQEIIPSGLFTGLSSTINNTSDLLTNINSTLSTSFSSLKQVKLNKWKRYSDIKRRAENKRTIAIDEIFQPSNDNDWEEIKQVNSLISNYNNASFGNVDISGSLQVLGETTINNTAKIGTITSSAAFAHKDCFNTTDYALRQNSSGDTVLNAASGQKIYFRINNSDIMSVNGDYLSLPKTVSVNTITSNPTVPSDVSPINEIRFGLYGNGLSDSVRLMSECRSTTGSSRWGYGFAIRNKWSLRSYVLQGATVYSTLYNATSASDDRLKFNESPITDALITIRQLNPVTYDKSDLINDSSNTIHRSGFIAQEVHAIPALAHAVVQGDEEREWSLFYDDIFTYTVSAIQELDSLVQSQQTEINDLKAENSLLKSKLNEILSEMGKETI